MDFFRLRMIMFLRAAAGGQPRFRQTPIANGGILFDRTPHETNFHA